MVGVNQGRLGFMTDISLHEMFTTIEAILHGEFVPEDRILLNASVQRDGVEVASTLAFNDVVFSRGATGSMIEFEIFIDKTVCLQPALGRPDCLHPPPAPLLFTGRGRPHPASHHPGHHPGADLPAIAVQPADCRQRQLPGRIHADRGVDSRVHLTANRTATCKKWIAC